MWTKSDKYNVFMLLWMILAAATSVKGFAVVCTVFALLYGIMTIYYSYKEEKSESNTN